MTDNVVKPGSGGAGPLLVAEPVVMFSSTILELLNVREQAAQRIDQSGIARSWRYEVHAVAAGASASEQYVGVARACDLFVLIVASDASAATEAEYLAAYDDNPEKILVFYVGDGSADVRPFRRQLDDRHARVQRETSNELVEPIAAAVIDVIRTGKILRPPLLARLDERIERARTLVSQVPVLLLPLLEDSDGSKVTPPSLLETDVHLALSGIGGSGKSMSAYILARTNSSDGRTLPIITTATALETDVNKLIRESCAAVRFRADSTIIDGWANDGRIHLVVDGIESVSEIDRMNLLHSIERWADQYPRCGVTVCARHFAVGELAKFRHMKPAPLEDSQLEDLRTALNFGSPSPARSPRVQDLARWPLWATALYSLAQSAQTGLELLQAIVATRLETAGITSQIEAAHLRAAAGHLALSVWPSTEISAANAIQILTAWQQDPVAADRFSPRPTEDLLGQLSASGLLEVGDVIGYPHRLFATLLAAESALLEESTTVAGDEELAPFVAALADDDSHQVFLRSIFSSAGIVAVARYLRLAPSLSRQQTCDSDSARLADGFQALSPRGESLDVLCTDNWVAWRLARDRSGTLASTDDYEGWRGSSDEPVEMWAGSPFVTHSPEFVAAVFAITQFRSEILQLSEECDAPREMSEAKVRNLIRRVPDLEASVFDAAQRWKRAREEYLERLGVRGENFGLTVKGEARVVVHVSVKTDPWVEIQWGSEEASVILDTDLDGPLLASGQSMALSRFLAESVEAFVHGELESGIEGALGCRLRSKAWSHPEAVPAWAW